MEGGEAKLWNFGAHIEVHTERGGGSNRGFGGGGHWEGIKRWGIEGIRLGTSDRFRRGRGEYNVY